MCNLVAFGLRMESGPPALRMANEMKPSYRLAITHAELQDAEHEVRMLTVSIQMEHSSVAELRSRIDIVGSNALAMSSSEDIVESMMRKQCSSDDAIRTCCR